MQHLESPVPPVDARFRAVHHPIDASFERVCKRVEEPTLNRASGQLLCNLAGSIPIMLFLSWPLPFPESPDHRVISWQEGFEDLFGRIFTEMTLRAEEPWL